MVHNNNELFGPKAFKKSIHFRPGAETGLCLPPLNIYYILNCKGFRQRSSWIRLSKIKTSKNDLLLFFGSKFMVRPQKTKIDSKSKCYFAPLDSKFSDFVIFYFQNSMIRTPKPKVKSKEKSISPTICPLLK